MRKGVKGEVVAIRFDLPKQLDIKIPVYKYHYNFT